MKVFFINSNKSIYLKDCEDCPAFASCCESGDECQIEHRYSWASDRVYGFPEWCPLDESN